VYDSSCFGQLVCNTSKKKGGGGGGEGKVFHALFFVIFVQNEICQIIKQVQEWDDHTIVTWDYEGEDVIYFPSQKKCQYDVHIYQILEDLLYKDIPLTLYVRTKNVMDQGECVHSFGSQWHQCQISSTCIQRSIFLIFPICIRTCCVTTSWQNFMFTTHMTILTQYDIC
jgi:hypothetical protein